MTRPRPDLCQRKSRMNIPHSFFSTKSSKQSRQTPSKEYNGVLISFLVFVTTWLRLVHAFLLIPSWWGWGDLFFFLPSRRKHATLTACVTARTSQIPAAPVSGAAPTCPRTPGQQQTVSPSKNRRTLGVLVPLVWPLDTSMVSSLTGNEPPVLHPPPPPGPLRSLQGHNFSYQLQARDPEGLAVLFILDSGPQGASLSQDGLLTWKAAVGASDTHTFLLTARDECGAKTRASLQVNTCVWMVLNPD